MKHLGIFSIWHDGRTHDRALRSLTSGTAPVDQAARTQSSNQHASRYTPRSTLLHARSHSGSCAIRLQALSVFVVSGVIDTSPLGFRILCVWGVRMVLEAFFMSASRHSTAECKPRTAVGLAKKYRQPSLPLHFLPVLWRFIAFLQEAPRAEQGEQAATIRGKTIFPNCLTGQPLFARSNTNNLLLDVVAVMYRCFSQDAARRAVALAFFFPGSRSISSRRFDGKR